MARKEGKGRGQTGPQKRVSPGKTPPWILIAIVLATAGVVLLVALPAPGTPSTWPRDRGPVSAFVESETAQENFTLVRLAYQSEGGTARAVLWLPNATNATAAMPAVVHMTGRTITAEGARDFAQALAALGVATLSVEKRGGDQELSAEKTRLWVWDLLRGFDHLRAPLPLKTRVAIDPERILVSGESIGANMAIVAAAAEPRIRGAMAISGFPDRRFGPELDPAQAVGKLAPRPVALFHAQRDPVVPFAEARALFDLAKEPRFLHEMNGTCHGYCLDFFPEVKEEVRRTLQV